jgi:predicted dehydrogenase
MGQKRAKALARHPRGRVCAVFDVDERRPAALQQQLGYEICASAETLIARSDVDVVVVAVPHYLTRDLAVAALEGGKHVFCEKPVGRTARECDEILATAERCGRELGVGFNFRHYPGVAEAYRVIQRGDLGEPTHLRCVLGHAARPGYDREWKTSKQLCGGGCLLDPGIHVIDLIRFLLGSIQNGSATLFRSFWNLEIEDNVFLTLQTVSGKQALAHISITEWRNQFALDIFGTEGCLKIQGRSGYYGSQSIQFTKRWSWLSEERVRQEWSRDYGPDDLSLGTELELFLSRVAGGNVPELATPADARAALDLIGKFYESSEIVDVGETYVELASGAAHRSGPSPI